MIASETFPVYVIIITGAIIPIMQSATLEETLRHYITGQENA